MTKIIADKRASGKTTKAVIESNETGRPILVANETQKKVVKDVAEHLCLTIPEPMTVAEVRQRQAAWFEKPHVIVDEMTHVLETALNINIKTATVTDEIYSRIIKTCENCGEDLTTRSINFRCSSCEAIFEL